VVTRKQCDLNARLVSVEGADVRGGVEARCRLSAVLCSVANASCTCDVAAAASADDAEL